MRGETHAPTPPRVDLNAAGKDELCTSLPGIGPVLADRIVAFREGQGRFSDPTELARIPGISARLAERLSERLSVTPGPVLEPQAPRTADSAGMFWFGSDPPPSAERPVTPEPQSPVAAGAEAQPDPSPTTSVESTGAGPSLPAGGVLLSESPAEPAPVATVEPDPFPSLRPNPKPRLSSSGMFLFDSLDEPSIILSKLPDPFPSSSRPPSGAAGADTPGQGSSLLDAPPEREARPVSRPEPSLAVADAAHAATAVTIRFEGPPPSKPATTLKPPQASTFVSPALVPSGALPVASGEPVLGPMPAQASTPNPGSKPEASPARKAELEPSHAAPAPTRASDAPPAQGSIPGLGPLDRSSMTDVAPGGDLPAHERTRARRRRNLMGAMAFTGMLIGAAVAWGSDRRAVGTTRASLDHVDRDVRSLHVDGDRTREEVLRQGAELARQGAELASAKEALAAVVLAQKAADARSARISQDVADLAERTRRAQARTDAKVYRLDEAIKLIDWATTTGFAHQAVADSHRQRAGLNPRAVAASSVAAIGGWRRGDIQAILEEWPALRRSASLWSRTIR